MNNTACCLSSIIHRHGDVARRRRKNYARRKPYVRFPDDLRDLRLIRLDLKDLRLSTRRPTRRINRSALFVHHRPVYVARCHGRL